MKNLLRAMIKPFVALFIALLAIAPCCFGQKTDDSSSIYSLTKQKNTLVPEVPSKQREAVRNYMHREAQALKKMGYKVETERNGEVIVVTIPASILFAPNESELLKEGTRKIEPLLSYLKSEDRFKMLLAMHTDDTGSEIYKTRLSEQRLQSVMEYVESNAAYPSRLVGYALADDEPLAPNDTRSHRALNRRLEIYIVPEVALLSQLKK